MFRESRKPRYAMSEESTAELLKNARRGVLAVNGDNGYPYAVPVNFLFDEKSGRIYFHGSREGHKTESVKACDKVCFTVYGNESVKKESWAPFVQSAVVFGRCKLLESGDRSTALLQRFAEKYYPDEETVLQTIERSGSVTQMFEIEIEHMTGKEIQEK